MENGKIEDVSGLVEAKQIEIGQLASRIQMLVPGAFVTVIAVDRFHLFRTGRGVVISSNVGPEDDQLRHVEELLAFMKKCRAK